MRSILAASMFATAILSACASPERAPAPAPAPAQTVKAPQCWNGDISQFQDVGTKAMISGVQVECKTTTDGKAAQWMGSKH